MEEKKEKEESLTKQLYHFAGSYKYLSILSTILAAISAFVALVPFYYIWKVMQEVLRVRFDFSKAAGISTYGWRAVGFAILGMIIYMAGLMCSHIAAFHVQAQMRTAMMNHIMTLPLGYIESEELVRFERSSQIPVQQQKHIWHIPFQIKQFPRQHRSDLSS